MEQNPFGTQQTIDFIKSCLPKSSRRILEVGAGNGRLTRALRENQFDVHAIDSSERAIRRAREDGVVVEEADITEFETKEPFDAVVFSMSAHHFHPLNEAMARTSKALRAGGVVLLEEYAVEDVDGKTASWYYEALALLNSIRPHEMDAYTLECLSDPLEVWRGEHLSHEGHHFNTGTELLAAVGKKFEILKTERVPYFYRYLTSQLETLPSPPDSAKKFFGIEKTLIENGRIKPIGLRVVGRLSNSIAGK